MRIRRRHAVALLALLAALAAVYVLWNHTRLVPDQVARRVSDNLLRQHGYRLELAAVHGTPMGEVVLVGPKLRPMADTTSTLLVADAVRLRLDRPWTLVRGRVVLDHLHLERPVVVLAAAREDTAPRAPRQGTPAFPKLVIQDLGIRGGRVLRRTTAGTHPVVVDIDARVSVHARPARLDVVLERASLTLPQDSLRVNDVGGSVAWAADSVRAEALRLHTSGTSVAGAASVAADLGGAQVAAHLAPLDLAELGRFLGRPLAGQLTGPVQVRWRGDEVVARGQLSGTVQGYAIEAVDFDVRRDAGGFAVRRLEGRIHGCPVEAQVAVRGDAWQGTLGFRDLDARTWVRDVRLPENHLTGRVGFERRSAGDTLRLDVALASGSVHGIPIESARARSGLLGRSARIHAASVRSPLGTLRGRGRVDGGDLQLDFDVAFPDVSRPARWLRLGDVRGDLAASGRLEGPLADLRLDAEVRFDRLQAGAARLREGAIGVWAHDLRHEPVVDAEVRADSLVVASFALANAAADLTYADRTLHVLRSQASAGDTTVAAVVTVQAMDHDWAGRRRAATLVRLETALLQLGAQEVRIEDPAAIWLQRGIVHVDSLRCVTRGGRLRLDGSLDRDNEMVAARAEIDAFDFEFLSRTLRLPHRLRGTASGWLEAQGSLQRTRLDARIEAWDGGWNELPFDSLVVAVRSDAEAVELRRLALDTEHGRLECRARLGYLPALGRWAASAHGTRSRADLAAAALAATLRLEDADVERLWQARAPGAPLPEWALRLSAGVEVEGTVGRPRVAASGAMTGVRRAGLPLGDVRFAARHDSERLQLLDVEVRNGEQTLHVEGSVPLRLDLTRGAALGRDAPVDGRIVLPRSSFEPVTRFVALLEPPPASLPPGEIEAELHVAGTLDAPELRGSMRVYGAAFTLRDLEEVYRDVHAVGDFSGRTLRFTELRAASGQGSVRGAGSIAFDAWRVGGYAFRFQLERFPIISIPDVSALVNGTLEIRSADVGGPQPVPDLRGTLDVLQAEITQEFAAEAEGSVDFDTDRPEFLANVELLAPKGKVWVKNSQVDAELAGNLQCIRDMQGLDFKGTATVRRGTYSLPFVRFEIRRGELDFSRHPGLDPEFDIEAQTGRRGDRTYVTLTGSLSSPRLDFRSDRTELTSEQIQRELVSVGTEEGAAAIADLAEQTIRDLRLLEYFSIDPANVRPDSAAVGGATKSSSALLSYNVSAGRAISDRIFLIYTQGVYSDIQQKVSLEIDLNRWLLMESSYERRSISGTGADQSQNAFDVNLKYRHEY